MMKSKFFSLNAKLALAVLAVGTMFTGCYDSNLCLLHIMWLVQLPMWKRVIL